MTTDKTAEALEREAFEAWFASLKRDVGGHPSGYSDATKSLMWKSWQARSLAQPAQAEVTDYARMLGATPTANEMDNLPHQDWCRWWRHGDICNCGAVTYPPAPRSSR